MKKIRFFSAFSGIGGFELGLENAAKSAGLEAECIGHAEIDKFAEAVYQNHFPGNKNYGDITKINAKELPDFDILVAGFCCQSYSTAGKRKGLKDERGQLVYDLIRIIKEKRPKIIVLENVKAILGNASGTSFSTILSELAELGLYVEWNVLNSSHYGVPQERERVIIVGVLGEIPSEPIFPLKPLYKTHFDENRIVSYSKSRDVVKFRDTANTIIASYKGLGNYNQPGVLEKNGRVRRFTPLECERLMGFPDYWTQYGADGKLISDSQRYRQCGNAVCPKVIEATFSRLFSMDDIAEDLA